MCARACMRACVHVCTVHVCLCACVRVSTVHVCVSRIVWREGSYLHGFRKKAPEDSQKKVCGGHAPNERRA